MYLFVFVCAHLTLLCEIFSSFEFIVIVWGGAEIGMGKDKERCVFFSSVCICDV